jgi:hypothetical protein
VANQFEVLLAAQMCNIGPLAAEEVVQTDDFVFVLQQSLAQMGTDEACTAGNQYSHLGFSFWIVGLRLSRFGIGLPPDGPRPVRHLAVG